MRHPKSADPAQIIETLLNHDVAFIIVGGVAAILHGSPTHPTR